MEKDLAEQVVFASQGLSFFVDCMDTAVFQAQLRLDFLGGSFLHRSLQYSCSPS